MANNGDKNTRYFHIRALMRRRKNLIKFLKKANGDIIDDLVELEEETTQFYKDLYTSEEVSNMRRK